MKTTELIKYSAQNVKITQQKPPSHPGTSDIRHEPKPKGGIRQTMTRYPARVTWIKAVWQTTTNLSESLKKKTCDIITYWWGFTDTGPLIRSL